MAAAQTNGKAELNGDVKIADIEVPEWINSERFESLLKENVVGFKKVKDFKVGRGTAAGENYATLMLRFEIQAELKDGRVKNLSYMMKVPLKNDLFLAVMKENNFFAVEVSMYREILPEFEQMYRAAGLEVKFGPECYKLAIDEHYVLLEDLRPRGFKNANRLEGLDMEHTRRALRKLAEWHAASAVRVDTKGKYSDVYALGTLRENNRPFVSQMLEKTLTPFMQCLKSYKGHEVYMDAIEKLMPCMTDELYKAAKVDAPSFNVLNHGDCWTNNIMFQYDAFGKIKETYFIDLQAPRYGSPAQDLLYFLISSVHYELKLKQFEYFIKYYHDNLVECLKLLKYAKKLPSLKDIHADLYKYGIWGFYTSCSVMAAALLDPNEQATFENLVGETKSATDFKLAMFSNNRFRKHIEDILPWLYNRGALEC